MIIEKTNLYFGILHMTSKVFDSLLRKIPMNGE